MSLIELRSCHTLLVTMEFPELTGGTAENTALKKKMSRLLTFPQPVLGAVSVLFLSHKPIDSHRAFYVAVAHHNFII